MLGGTLAAQTGLAVGHAIARDDSGLEAQREAAASVSELDADWIATTWGGTVSVVVLSGAHVALVDAPPETIGSYPQLYWGDAGWCTDAPLLEGGGYVVCGPPAG